MNSLPLVSIVIPAYKGQYFERALASACRQTYGNLEIVVCDDSRGKGIEGFSEAYSRSTGLAIRYSRNGEPLGERGNLARCVARARGKYLKVLHDDDELQPECVERLVAAMESNPSLSMASSRRLRIDDDGKVLADIVATVFPFQQDTVIEGRGLIAFLAHHTINFIGEPSCIMCRREDALAFGDQLMSLGGRRIDWVADLALYVKLLNLGNLAMLAAPLTHFRVSRAQSSQLGRDRPGIGNQGHENFRQALRDLGWIHDGSDPRTVRIAPLAAPEQHIEYDLLDGLGQAWRRNQSGQAFRHWLDSRVPAPVQKRLIDAYLATGVGPRLAVIVIGETCDHERLKVTLESLSSCAAFYPNHEIVVVGGELPTPLAGQSVRTVTPEAKGLAASLNGILADSEAPWLMLAQAGDAFTPAGLMMAGLDLAGSPGCRALYPDEIHRKAVGGLGLALRPDFNLDMLLSFPAALARHCLFGREALQQIGGFEAVADEALELTALLRLVESGGLAGLGHLSEPLVIADAPRLADCPAERLAIQAHLRARGYSDARVSVSQPGLYAIDYGHATTGTASLLVTVGEDLARVQHCVESILEGTRHEGYEILLVATASRLQDEALAGWLGAVEAMGAAQVRVVRAAGDHPAQAINQAAAAALGEYLVLLDGECAVLHEDWLTRLLNHAQRPEVGPVGALLLSPDGRVRHAGLLLGLQGPVGRPFVGRPLDAPSHLHRLQIDQNYSAVSGECLMIARETFSALGGLDEGELGRYWYDVDLCLRASEAGYLCVWTPRARLLQRGAEPAPPRPEQMDLIYARWLPALARDPAYNPNFSRQAEGGFQLADVQLAWRPLMAWRPVPVVLAHQADEGGCGHYRVIQPFQGMREAGLVDGAVSGGLMHVVDLERYDPDTIVLQRQIGEDRLEAMRRMKAFSRAFKVYELDDYLPNLPLKSPHRIQMPKDIVRSLRRGLKYVDRFVVSTEPLAEALSGFHPEIVVVENRLPEHWWSNLKARRRVSGRPRVGWAGGIGHTGDLELIVDVVRELAAEVDWVFMGMCPEPLKPYVEFVPGAAIESYPRLLASLNLDLAIAPLEQNLFNERKSNLRLLEYGACGFPVVCSDIRPYQGDLPVTRVRNRFRDWVEAIRMHVADLDATALMGDRLREAVLQDWMLNDTRLAHWRDAWLP
ncbi:glycosyltransferase [Stutzerimonas kunmingensis]|uniref:glycosyltransferase n=1 Tax=Stutzerimonas kunmingensis TaxID=1211807 RepID=UPI00241E2DAD|nr:glycosyltransferase [Stutzerimonas kunmingensis]